MQPHIEQAWNLRLKKGRTVGDMAAAGRRFAMLGACRPALEKIRRSDKKWLRAAVQLTAGRVWPPSARRGEQAPC
jgi:hypothetical protein